MSNTHKLSKNIKNLRKRKNFSQEKLARMADVANNTIIKIESGENQNPTLKSLRKISMALGVSINDLLR
jgi:transcriptional regulator with XRE-family HTH domain